MELNYHIIAQPTVEPVALALAKSQLNVEASFTDDDLLIGAYITAARQFCEREICRAIYPQTWMMSMDHFPWFDFRDGTFRQTNRSDWPFYTDFWEGITIKLPMPRCLSVISITYVDLTGARQTLDPSTYYVDTTSEPCRIVPQPGTYWPYTQQYIPGSVQVTFIAATYAWQIPAEAINVPAEAPYTVTLARAAKFLQLNGIVNGGGGAIPSSQYTVADGIITFLPAQAGLALQANYYAGDCPQTIVVAIMQMVADWYSNRENSVLSSGINVAEMPYGIKRLLDSERFYAFTLENN
jgi:hypothetical protein